MVAVGDFGISEREDMVRLALSRKWIDNAHQKAIAAGMTDAVVMLVAVDAMDALPFRWNGSPRNRAMEQKQRTAGCKPFVVAVARYADVLASNSADAWEDDMEEMRRKGGVSLVVINRTGQFLASITEHVSE